MKADYIDHMGTDLTVVNAARVSMNKHTDELREQDIKLIHYLSRNGHWTPFAQPQISLRLTVPFFVARQDFKHQIGFTRNEVSRRYVDDTPEFFVPDVWRSRPDTNIKQGSGGPIQHNMVAQDFYQNVCNRARADYQYLLDMGVAPEQARMVLPESTYTSYYVTASLAAWARAYKQRTDSHAQQEIQELYRAIGTIIYLLFPVSWPALTDTLDTE